MMTGSSRIAAVRPAAWAGRSIWLAALTVVVLSPFATPAAIAEQPIPLDAISTDPTLTPARPPEGFAVGLVGAGLDYREPAIGPCLARDGEGLPISWDLIDQNETPFEANMPATALGQRLCETGQMTLVVARYGPDQPLGLPDALGFTFQTPARLLVIANRPLSPRHLQWLKLAGDRAPERLILIAAEDFPNTAPAARRVRPPAPVPDTVLVTGTDGAKLDAARALGFTTLALEPAAPSPGAEFADAIARLARVWQTSPGLTAGDLTAALRLAAGASGASAALSLAPQADLAAAAARVDQQNRSQQGGTKP